MRVLLVIYDNDSYTAWLPLGLAYVSSALKRAGFLVDVFDQQVTHAPDHALTEHIERTHPDAVLLSCIGGYYQHARAIALSRAVRAVSYRVLYGIGGHGPAGAPDYFRRICDADFVWAGEAESTLPGVLLGGTPTGIIHGTQVEDVDSLPWPDYDAFNVSAYRMLRMPNCKPTDYVMPVLSGRGCPYHCTFCYRLDDGFRPRKAEAVLEEVRWLQHTHGITYVAFGDELLMSSTRRTEDFCEAILSSGMSFRWSCCGRLNFATKGLVELMKSAGCVFVNYGIEAVDDSVLRNIRKGLTVSQIVSGVEATLAARVSPGLNIIWGNEGDNPETLWAGVNFLKKYVDGSQLRTIRPVTPYPGSPLFDHAVKACMFKDAEDFYARHVNSDLFSVNFMGMSNAEAHQHLWRANDHLLEHYYTQRMHDAKREAADLYKGNSNFRGFRQT
jgi:anaerobic magnesium-protoporphyrin IX monomethyl ester cyclase